MTAPPALSLRELQQWFLQVVTHPESLEAGVASEAGVVPPSRLELVVRAGREETALERLAIYRHAYFARLVECLADDYPALRHALGTEPFEELCRAYVAAHPPREKNLNDFGRHLSAFVKQRLRDRVPFAPDLARLEWALVEVLHAPTPEPFPADAVQRIPPERLGAARFVPSGAARLLSLEYPVNAYLQAFFEERAPSPPDLGPNSVAVARSGYKIWRIELLPAPAAVLRRLMAGEPLLAAFDGVDVTPEQLHAWFRDWTACGMFAGVEL